MITATLQSRKLLSIYDLKAISTTTLSLNKKTMLEESAAVDTRTRAVDKNLTEVSCLATQFSI